MSPNTTSYPREKINILLLENISQTAVENLYRNGYANVQQIPGALNEADLIRALKNVHLVGIRSKSLITKNVLDHCPKLQAVGAFCIGTNQIDLAEANRQGVAVFNAPYSNTRSVAELVVGASIMLIRRIMEKNDAAHKGIWKKEATGSREIRGKVLGIVGYGNIGSQVSILAEAMGMKVVYYDILTKLPLGNAVRCHSLSELLQQADLVTLHVPDTPDTKNMINAKTLKHFKPGSLLINYARGEVMDLDAVAGALAAEKLGGVAVDVYPEEPEKNGQTFKTPLQGLPNVILTPHIGGSTLEAQENIGLDVSSKLLNYLETGNSFGSMSIPPINLPQLEGAHRILHIHDNVPGVLSEINTTLGNAGVNILGQYLATNNDVGYVVLDVDTKLSNKAVTLLKAVHHTIRTRMLY